jgi:hypothetical protein
MRDKINKMYETIWNLRKKVEKIRNKKTKRLGEKLLESAGVEADLLLRLTMGFEQVGKDIDIFTSQMEDMSEEYFS